MRNALSLWRDTNPFANFLEVQKDFDRFFDEPWTSSLPASRTLGKDWNPRAAITEDDVAYHVKVDLPGVVKDQVKVDYHDNYLTVSGERKDEKKTDKEKEHYSEVFFGSFTRTFYFPQAVDAERIAAKYENGVLTVDLTKTTKSQARQVAVK